MNSISRTSVSVRMLVTVIGVALGAALLALDDLPRSLAANGKTVPVLWSVAAVIWVLAVWRVDAFQNACARHRKMLLRIARHGAVYYGAILVALFYLMWVAGRLWMGNWPQAVPDHDPKGMPATAIVYLLICGWFWLGPAAIALPIVRLWIASRSPRIDAVEVRQRVAELAVTLLLIGLAVAWLRTDPHELVKWFLD